jgi:hypothetical protein
MHEAERRAAVEMLLSRRINLGTQERSGGRWIGPMSFLPSRDATPSSTRRL